MSMAGAAVPPARFRSGLRTIFALISCLAIGLAINRQVLPGDAAGRLSPMLSFNWESALWDAVTAGLILGLIRQTVELVRWDAAHAEQRQRRRFSFRIECCWRCALASMLCGVLVLRVLFIHFGWEHPPSSGFWYGDLWLKHVPRLTFFLALNALLPASRAVGGRIRSRSIDALVLTLGLGIVVIASFDGMLVVYLTHAASVGVHLAMAGGGKNFWLNTPARQGGFFGLALLALIAWSAAGWHLWQALRRPGDRPLLGGKTIAAGILLAAVAGYVIWYYAAGYPRASPNLAETEFAASWLLQLGGVVMGVMLVTAGAIRVGPAPDAEAVEVPTSREFCQSPYFLILLATAVAAYLTNLIRSIVDLLGDISPWDIVFYSLKDSGFLLQLAILILSLQYVWRTWRGRREAAVLPIRRFTASRLATAWIGLAALLAVGAPVLKAFVFACWLSPWYYLR